jgi:hypothetical protein
MPSPVFSSRALLSVFIEGWFLKWSMRREPQPVTNLYYLSAVANIASYTALGVLVWVWTNWI